MSDKISLSKTSLVRLVDGLLGDMGFPAPNDTGWRHRIPWHVPEPGPIVMVDPRPAPWFAAVAAAGLINPQPLPPGSESVSLRTVALARWLAQTEIRQTLAQFQATEMLAGPRQAERLLETVHRRVDEFADWYCGNGVIPLRVRLILDWILHHHPPIPHIDPAGPVEQLVAGVEFQHAAGTASPLQKIFKATADQFFAAGMDGLAGTGRKAAATRT